MDDEETINLLNDAMLYAHVQCSKCSCSICPAVNSHAQKLDNCELHFVQEYLTKNKYYISKED